MNRCPGSLGGTENVKVPSRKPGPQRHHTSFFRECLIAIACQEPLVAGLIDRDYEAFVINPASPFLAAWTAHQASNALHFGALVEEAPPCRRVHACGRPAQTIAVWTVARSSHLGVECYEAWYGRLAQGRSNHVEGASNVGPQGGEICGRPSACIWYRCRRRWLAVARPLGVASS